MRQLNQARPRPGRLTRGPYPARLKISIKEETTLLAGVPVGYLTCTSCSLEVWTPCGHAVQMLQPHPFISFAEYDPGARR
jgi:hypothetical protein